MIVDAPNTAYALQAKKILRMNGLKDSDYTLKPVGGTLFRYRAMREDKSQRRLDAQPAVLDRRAGRRTEEPGPRGRPDRPLPGDRRVRAAQVGERQRASCSSATSPRSIEATRWTVTPANKEAGAKMLAERFKLAARGGGAHLGAARRSQVRPRARTRKFDKAGFRNVLALRAEIEGSWGGKRAVARTLRRLELLREGGSPRGRALAPLQRRWLPYFIALLAVCAALGLRAGLDPWLGSRVPYITLFGAVIVAAWFGGAGPALAAAPVAWLGAQLLFVEPRGQLHWRGTETLIEILAYAVSTLLIAALGGAMQSARRRSTESEQHFRAFMQNSPSGVFLKDEDGRYLFMNRAAERLVGRTDWLGKSDSELIEGRSAGEILEHDRAVLEQNAPRLYDLRLQTPQGERTLSSVKFPLRDAAGRRYVGSITSDVTEQRAAEEALRDADRRKDEFLATLAHELRNPLAPIRTAVAILGREGAAEPDRAWSRAVIERQVGAHGAPGRRPARRGAHHERQALLRRERVHARRGGRAPRSRPAGRCSRPPATSWSTRLPAAQVDARRRRHAPRAGARQPAQQRGEVHRAAAARSSCRRRRRAARW